VVQCLDAAFTTRLMVRLDRETLTGPLKTQANRSYIHVVVIL
jgi:hypothetical protein